jgi:hypothetical protein
MASSAFPSELDNDDRQTGKRYLRRFVMLNGISIAFLMNDLLILYGIRNGLSDPQLAVLSSFMHLTMPFLLVGKLLIPRFGLARTWGDAWILRYVFGSILIAAPFMAGRFAQSIVAATVLLGAFGFAMFRSIGIVANTPLTGEVTVYEERGSFLSGNWVRSQTAYFFSVTIVVLLMRFFDKVWVYQAVIGLGCLVGFYASRQLIKIPESSAPSKSAAAPLSESYKLLKTRRTYRRLLGGWAAGISSFVLVIPFSIVAIKNGYGISDYHALVFSLFILAGGIFSSYTNGRVADTVGPRPLLILYIAGFFVSAGFWAVAPAKFFPVLVALVFLLQGYCKTGLIIATNHYFLQVVGPEDRVGLSLFARMTGGLVAGIASALGGGTAFSLIRALGVEGLDVYRIFFRFVLGVLALLLVLAFRTEKLSGEKSGLALVKIWRGRGF